VDLNPALENSVIYLTSLGLNFAIYNVKIINTFLFCIVISNEIGNGKIPIQGPAT
jgi:hypothetical protein